jgi:hypothetical protein
MNCTVQQVVPAFVGSFERNPARRLEGFFERFYDQVLISYLLPRLGREHGNFGLFLFIFSHFAAGLQLLLIVLSSSKSIVHSRVILPFVQLGFSVSNITDKKFS